MNAESGSVQMETPTESRRRSLLDLACVVFGKFSTVAVVLVGGVIIARHGGKEDYAIFATAITAALLLDSVLGTAFDLAVVRHASLLGAKSLATSRFQALAFYLKCGCLVLVTGACGLTILASAPPWLADFPVWPTLFAASGLLVARSVAVNAQIRGEFRVYSALDVFQGLARLVLFALLALVGVTSSTTYLSAYAITGFAVLLVGIFVLKQDFLSRCKANFDETGRLLAYAGVTAVVVACGAMTGRGDFLLLSFTSGKSGLADYGAASQICQLLSQLSLYASVLTQPRVLKDLRAGNLHRLFLATLAAVLVIALGCAALWHAGAFHLLICILFGPQLQGAIAFLPVLLIGGILDLLLVPVPMTLGVLAAPRLAAAGEVILTFFFFALGFWIVKTTDEVGAQMKMAWLFTGVRAAKLLLYGGIAIFVARRQQAGRMTPAVSI